MAMIPNLVPRTDSGSVADKVLIWGRWTPWCVPSSFYMCFLLTVLGVAKG